MKLGEMIKEKRREKGLTQEELANLCGLSKNGIWNYENDKRIPNMEILFKIATKLEIPLSEFIKPGINLIGNTIGTNAEHAIEQSHLQMNEIKYVYCDIKHVEAQIDNLCLQLDKLTTQDIETGKGDIALKEITSLTAKLTNLGVLLATYIPPELKSNSYIDSFKIFAKSNNITIDNLKDDQLKKLIQKVVDFANYEIYKLEKNKSE